MRRAIECLEPWVSVGRGLLVRAALLFLVACASQPPTERMETAAATIRAAEEAGAVDVPQAALHLQLAKEQSEHAKKLIEQDEEYEKAESLLLRAQADGELAVALAHANANTYDARQAVERTKDVKQQGQKQQPDDLQ